MERHPGVSHPVIALKSQLPESFVIVSPQHRALCAGSEMHGRSGLPTLADAPAGRV